MVNGAPFMIWAGVDTEDPSQGVVSITKFSLDRCAKSGEGGSENLLVGDHAGPIDVIELVGARVTLRFTWSGCTGIYTVHARSGSEKDLFGRLAVPSCEPPLPPNVAVATAE